MNAISRIEGASTAAFGFNSTKASSTLYSQSSSVNNNSTTSTHSKAASTKLEAGFLSAKNSAMWDSYTTKTNRNKSKAGVEVTTYTDKEGRVHRTYTGKGNDVVESMQAAMTKSEKNKPVAKKRLNYSYQKVSNQVIMAKTSVSASKAVLSARRALSDLKRALRSADCSDDEKQAALTHATRMLQIAKKKRNNLELEELIGHTITADEHADKVSAANRRILELNGAFFDEDDNKPKGDEDILAKIASESDSEDGSADSQATDIDYELMAHETSYEASPEASELSSETDELLEELSDSLDAELSEVLNDIMDMMEIINPHMDRDDLAKLKNKHRCEEQKEIVKADTDYLKEYIRIIKEEQASSTTNSSDSSQAPLADMFPDATPANVTVSVAPETSIGFTFTC